LKLFTKPLCIGLLAGYDTMPLDLVPFGPAEDLVTGDPSSIVANDGGEAFRVGPWRPIHPESIARALGGFVANF